MNQPTTKPIYQQGHLLPPPLIVYQQTVVCLYFISAEVIVISLFPFAHANILYYLVCTSGCLHALLRRILSCSWGSMKIVAIEWCNLIISKATMDYINQLWLLMMPSLLRKKRKVWHVESFHSIISPSKVRQRNCCHKLLLLDGKISLKFPGDCTLIFGYSIKFVSNDYTSQNGETDFFSKVYSDQGRTIIW